MFVGNIRFKFKLEVERETEVAETLIKFTTHSQMKLKHNIIAIRDNNQWIMMASTHAHHRCLKDIVRGPLGYMLRSLLDLLNLRGSGIGVLACNTKCRIIRHNGQAR